MNQQEYEAYRKTDHWQKVRALALERDGHACRVCNRTENLDVHHRTYERVGREDPNDVTTLCSSCHQLFHDAGAEELTVHGMQETINVIYDQLDARQSSEDWSVAGLPTGYIDLDEILAGLQPRTLIIVGARPSVGKTALVLNLARHICFEQDRRVLFFTLEQSRIELVERLLCCEARVDLHRLKKGHLSAEDWDRLIKAADVARKTSLHFVDSPSQSVESISVAARKMKVEHGLDLVIVDYLQLLETRRRFQSREQEVARISRSLRRLANELTIPIIACSQLNRESEDRIDHQPKLSNLRESGALEMDADIVMLLHRPEMYDPGQHEGTCEVMVAKNRNGPTGEVTLTFLKQFCRFETFAVEAPFSCES